MSTGFTDSLLKKSKPANDTPRPKTVASSTDTRARKWAMAALDAECSELAATPEGQRNQRLNTAAFALGQIVAGGSLSDSEAWDALREAAQRCGLGHSETEATIASGMGAGQREPRTAPEPDAVTIVTSGKLPPPANEAQAREQQPPVIKDSIPVQPTPRPKVEIIDAAGIWAPLEEPKYVVAPIIRAGSLTEIVAYGGSGKSWIGADLVLSVAAGVPWLERYDTTQGGALYLDYENGKYEMQRRMQAIACARSLPTPVKGTALVTMPSLYTNDASFESQVMPLADGRALIVIDTWKAASPGIDENSSDMRYGLDALRRAGEKTGCAFGVLLHSKKVTGSQLQIDAREAGRGSSAIYDAADTVLHIAYEQGKPLLVVQTKSRMGRTIDPFQVTIEDLDGGAGGVRVWAEAVPEAEGKGESFEALCDKVLKAVVDNPGASGRIIRARVGGKPNNVLAALEFLEMHGAIRNKGTKSAAKWFRC
jgi:hypothetical protein